MKKIALVIIVCLIVPLTLAGCYTGSEPLPTGYNNVPPVTITVTPPAVTSPAATVVTTQVIDMNNQTFVYPARLSIDRMSSDVIFNFKFQLHNGQDYDTEFAVYYERPIDTSNRQYPTKEMPNLDGYYQPAPESAVEWLEFQSIMSVQSKWTENVNIKLSIPDGAYTPSKWYFVISTRDNNQGNVAGANGVTVYVNMFE